MVAVISPQEPGMEPCRWRSWRLVCPVGELQNEAEVRYYQFQLVIAMDLLQLLSR